MSWSSLAATAVLALFAGSADAATPAPASGAKNDGELLRAHLLESYPSLTYVERYRALFPDEAQGDASLWKPGAPAPTLDSPSHIAAALAQLQDQHVALVGPVAGKAETLGALFRSATDGSVIAWRVFGGDASRNGLRRGDRVLAIDGVPAKQWLQRSARLTFGGNRRGRQAEAALDLGMATPVVHRVAGLGASVALRVQSPQAHALPHTLRLRYTPMDEALATAMAAAIQQSDLPETFDASGLRIGTLRLGAFAPQYDPRFIAASDKASEVAGTSDDAAMLVGYCAVVDDFVAHADAVAAHSDVLLLDLRGNMGGFDREARLLMQSLAPKPIAATYDWFPTATSGTARLKAEIVDPPCAHLREPRPLLVLTDAGTRSAGEFSAAWLWQAGATVIGESTAGAGGGYEFGNAPDFELPTTKLRVRSSANFSLFDPTGELHEGEIPAQALVELASREGFRPSRLHPFAIQSVGLRPDLPLSTSGADLQDGGVGSVRRAVAALRVAHALPWPKAETL